MFKRVSLLFIFSCLLLAKDIVSVKSPLSVQETVKNLEQFLPKNTLSVISKIDMKEWAHKAGLDTNEEIILMIGNPLIDTKMLLNDARVALELPIKIVVYKGFKGDTWIVYKEPDSYKNTYRLNHCSILPDLKSKIDKSIKEAISHKIDKEKKR